MLGVGRVSRRRTREGMVIFKLTSKAHLRNIVLPIFEFLSYVYFQALGLYSFTNNHLNNVICHNILNLMHVPIIHHSKPLILF